MDDATNSNPPAASPPILPFSPLCLIDPTLPQCSNYIRGVGPANCSAVSSTCEAELFRLNHTLAIDVTFASFVADNLHCDLTSVQPCWESNDGPNSTTAGILGSNTGRFQQGSCTINCTHNRTQLDQVCQSHAGFLCDSEYNVGLDGTELKVILPVCLPLSCRRNSSEESLQRQPDLRAIQSCLEQHTCGALSTRARQLVPECSVSLPGCVGEYDIWRNVVLVLLSLLGFFSLFILFLRCFHERKKNNKRRLSNENGGRNQRNKGEYFVRQASSGGGSGGESSSSTELEDPLARPLLAAAHSTSTSSSSSSSSSSSTSRYILSDDLAHQQIRGRFALGARDDAALHHHHNYQMGSSLTYRNLFFRYLGRRLVLKGVSGMLSRGSCVAVVGAPDSGTTTLLRCLAGRQPKGKLEGSLLIDGSPPDKTRKIFFLSPFEIH